MLFRLFLALLPCIFFVACGGKKADVLQGGSETVEQPQEQKQEVIEEYEPQKPKIQADLLKSVYFAFDSFVISKTMFQVVNDNAEYLKQYPDQKIVLEGNTDSYGSDEYNFALGNKRALAVKEALVVKGIKKDQIEVVSFGETKPVCTKDKSPKCMQENRRVDFVLKAN